MMQLMLMITIAIIVPLLWIAIELMKGRNYLLVLLLVPGIVFTPFGIYNQARNLTGYASNAEIDGEKPIVFAVPNLRDRVYYFLVNESGKLRLHELSMDRMTDEDFKEVVKGVRNGVPTSIKKKGQKGTEEGAGRDSGGTSYGEYGEFEAYILPPPKGIEK